MGDAAAVNRATPILIVTDTFCQMIGWGFDVEAITKHASFTANMITYRSREIVTSELSSPRKTFPLSHINVSGDPSI